MGKSLTNSAIDRENILNNPLAISKIQEKLDIKGIFFNGEYRLTTRQIADFFDVDERTIKRFIENNRDELLGNGYEVLSGEELVKFKMNGRDMDVPTIEHSSVLGIFNFRSFLNIGMLLNTSGRAKQLRNQILDIVVGVINEKAGGNTKYINQRDDNYIIAAYYNDGYHKEFIDALTNYVDADKAKYPNYTDRLYKEIFYENTAEYKKILDLAKQDKARETMYSEVITAISSFEAGVADYIKTESNELGKKLSREEVDKVFDDIAKMPTMKPLIDMARMKMASLDRALRNVEHPNIAGYTLPLDKADFERFLGEKSKELSERINENLDILDRLKDK